MQLSKNTASLKQIAHYFNRLFKYFYVTSILLENINLPFTPGKSQMILQIFMKNRKFLNLPQSLFLHYAKLLYLSEKNMAGIFEFLNSDTLKQGNLSPKSDKSLRYVCL